MSLLVNYICKLRRIEGKSTKFLSIRQAIKQSLTILSAEETGIMGVGNFHHQQIDSNWYNWIGDQFDNI